MSLYRSLLGASLDDLPDPLRSFHDAPDVGRAVGSFRVERPARLLARALGSLLGFPPARESVTVVLVVAIEGARERWVRSFDGQRIVTLQEASQQHLVERFGAASLLYSLSVAQGALVYDLVGMRFFGVPVPRFLRPADRSIEQGTREGWEVSVRISLPILGELVRYGGRLRWERTAEAAPG